MKNHLVRSLLAFLISTKTAWACYPDPTFAYDEVATADISIVTASVTTVEVTTTETISCWHVDYSDAQYLYGHGTKEFSVTTCTDEVYQIDALSEEAEGLEHLGLIPNAEVLLGVVHPSEKASDLRYAIPSCWGPLHVNLGKMSGDERTEFLRDFKTQIEKIR